MALRVFVCEYITGGGLFLEDLPASLLREGAMMTGALIRDLADLADVKLSASRDPRLDPADIVPPGVPPGAPVQWCVPTGADDVWPSWRRAMADADAIWPIAPETGGVLERLSAMAVEHHCTLLGSSPDAIHITTSKSTTAQILAECGVPVVPTYPASGPWPESAKGWVAKADDGAGATDIGLFDETGTMRRWLADDGRGGADYVVQPYIEGEAASISMLARDGAAWILSCNRQHIAIEDGGFRYSGGIVAGLEEKRQAFAAIAAKIAAAIPGLWGYVGIDLIETSSGPLVLEVNPRLTTSYVGLRAAIGHNPAGLVLDLLAGAPTASIGEGPPTPVEVTLEAGHGEVAGHG